MQGENASPLHCCMQGENVSLGDEKKLNGAKPVSQTVNFLFVPPQQVSGSKRPQEFLAFPGGFEVCRHATLWALIQSSQFQARNL